MRRDALAVLALIGVALATLLPALGFPPFLPPFNDDNLDALNIAVSDDPWFFAGGASNFVYRPLTYFSFWLQNQVFGLRPAAFFSANLGVWVGCALVLYTLVRIHVRSALVALLAAAALLTDHRVDTALVWIIERQSILACLFGGTALAIAYRLPAGGRSRAAGLVAVFLLLIAAMLSKEYGAAFVAASACVALGGRPEQRARILGACVAAAVAYAAMRWLPPLASTADPSAPASSGVPGTGSGSSGRGYCEDMGLLWDQREVCYGEIGLAERLRQQAWNVGATLVGTVYPYLFEGQGNLSSLDLVRPVQSLVYPTMLLGLAITAWVKRPRAALPFLVLVLANAALNYLLFRHRNQLIGGIGLYASAAIGLQPAATAVSARLPRKAITPGAVAVVAGGIALWGIGNEARNLQNSVEQYRTDFAAHPCVYRKGPIAPQVRRLIEGMPAASRCRSGGRQRVGLLP